MLHLCQIWFFKLLIELYLAHWPFLEQGGTCWQHVTHKWYAIRKSLGTSCFTESIKKHTEDTKAHRKHRHSEGVGYSLKKGKWRAGTLVNAHRHSEGVGYSLKRGKWWAGTLVNALRVAKIRSNLHTGQYAGGVPSDHGLRQALLEPLSRPGVAWNVNEFLFKTALCVWFSKLIKKVL